MSNGMPDFGDFLRKMLSSGDDSDEEKEEKCIGHMTDEEKVKLLELEDITAMITKLKRRHEALHGAMFAGIKERLDAWEHESMRLDNETGDIYVK